VADWQRRVNVSFRRYARYFHVNIESRSHCTPNGVPSGLGCFVLPTLRPAGTQQFLYLIVLYELISNFSGNETWRSGLLPATLRSRQKAARSYILPLRGNEVLVFNEILPH